MLGIPKAFREEAGIAAGDNIVVTIALDETPRTVEVPADLAKAIEKAKLTVAWEKLSYTHKKEHVRAIEEAKQEATRIKRIEKAVAMIAAKSK